MNNTIKEKRKLEERIKAGKPSPRTPKELPLAQIEIIEEVFHCRFAESGSHVDELVSALKNTRGKPLPPLTVFWAGDAWVVIDGHHRYEAYKRQGYKKRIPVKVFSGDPDEAMALAGRSNSRDKLTMSRSEKSNFAWKLVLATKLSLTAIEEATTRSRQTIITMRKTRDYLLEKKVTDVQLIEMGWEEANRRYRKGHSSEINFDEDWQEKEAKELANSLSRTFGQRPGEQPDIFWRGIEIYDKRLIRAFLERYGITEEDMMNEEREDECASEIEF